MPCAFGGACSDDSDTSELSVEAMATIKEEEAMEKAAEGDFIADICVVCAFGLPKVFVILFFISLHAK